MASGKIKKFRQGKNILEIKMECNFCQIQTDGKLVLRYLEIEKKDGSDIVLCSECLNLYSNHEYEELEKRMKGLK